jgi:hypothetical protein
VEVPELKPRFSHHQNLYAQAHEPERGASRANQGKMVYLLQRQKPNHKEVMMELDGCGKSEIDFFVPDIDGKPRQKRGDVRFKHHCGEKTGAPTFGINSCLGLLESRARPTPRAT